MATERPGPLPQPEATIEFEPTEHPAFDQQATIRVHTIPVRGGLALVCPAAIYPDHEDRWTSTVAFDTRRWSPQAILGEMIEEGVHIYYAWGYQEARETGASTPGG